MGALNGGALYTHTYIHIPMYLYISISLYISIYNLGKLNNISRSPESCGHLGMIPLINHDSQ